MAAGGKDADGGANRSDPASLLLRAQERAGDRPRVAPRAARRARCHRVRFTTAAGPTNELFEAQATHRLSRVAQQLLRHQVLILDEVGFVSFTKAGADLLFSILAALHERVSVLVTTMVPFAEWAALFGGDQRLTAALLDRLTFRAHIVQFTGDSFRLRQSLKRQEEDRRPR